MIIQFVFEKLLDCFDKLLDWIRLDSCQCAHAGLDGEASLDSDSDNAFSDEEYDGDDSFQVISERSAATESFRVVPAPSTSTTEPDDDAYWMPSPNGKNGRYLRPRRTRKVPVWSYPGSWKQHLDLLENTVRLIWENSALQ